MKYMKYMKYLKKLFISFLEPLTIIMLEYCILILTILILGIDKSIIYGTILLIIYEIGYIVYKWRKSSKKLVFDNIPYFPYALLGIGIATFYNMIIFRLGINTIQENDISTLLVIISSAIIGPIFEEVLFRYSLMSKLEKFNSPRITILIASLIFALFHNNWWTMIYAFIIGYINAYHYQKYKNITIPIVIHMSANTIVTFLTGYNVWILILSFILTIISIILLTKNNKDFNLEKS